jgi:hypothetical protein
LSCDDDNAFWNSLGSQKSHQQTIALRVNPESAVPQPTHAAKRDAHKQRANLLNTPLNAQGKVIFSDNQ